MVTDKQPQETAGGDAWYSVPSFLFGNRSLRTKDLLPEIAKCRRLKADPVINQLSVSDKSGPTSIKPLSIAVATASARFLTFIFSVILLR